MEAYRTPDERFDELAGWPYTPQYLEQDGLRMHYVEKGAGEPVLLLHGEPTWGFLYRRMIPALSAVGRVFAPDLFGSPDGADLSFGRTFDESIRRTLPLP